MLEKDSIKGAPKYIVVVTDGEDRHYNDPWGGYSNYAKRWFFTVESKTRLAAEIRRHAQPGRTMVAYTVALEKVKI